MPLVFDIGQTYTFNTLASSILGSVVKNAKLVCVVDYDNVIKYHNFIDTTYANILSLLPEGTPVDAKSSLYYIFKSESGETLVISQYWVDEDSVEVVEFISFKVTVTNATLGDMQTVRDLLVASNLLNFNIEQL